VNCENDRKASDTKRAKEEARRGDVPWNQPAKVNRGESQGELLVNRKSRRRSRGATPIEIKVGSAQHKETSPLKRIENQESIDH
jgi:hypothetical protein